MKKKSKRMSSMKRYKSGGKMKMYKKGGGLGTAGSIMQTAAPFVGMIPGIGTIASPIISAAGGLMSAQQDKRDLEEANKLTNQREFINQNLQNKRGNYGFMEDGGQLMEVNGPKHEQGGVKLPQFNAEVEGGETINKDNMFVNSDHLGYDKDGYPTMNPKAVKTTFADKSKKIENKYKNKKSYEELMGEKFSQKMVNLANEKVTPPEPTPQAPQQMMQQPMDPAMMQGQQMQDPAMQQSPMEGQMPMGEEAMPPEMMQGQMRMGGSLYKKYRPGGNLDPLPAVNSLTIPQIANQYMNPDYSRPGLNTQNFNTGVDNNISSFLNTLPQSNIQSMDPIAPMNSLNNPGLRTNFEGTNPDYRRTSQINMDRFNNDVNSLVAANTPRGSMFQSSVAANNINTSLTRNPQTDTPVVDPTKKVTNNISSLRERLGSIGQNRTLGDKMNLVGAGLGMAAQIPSFFMKPEQAISRNYNPQLNYNRYNTTQAMNQSNRNYLNYTDSVNRAGGTSSARAARLLAGLSNTDKQQDSILRQAQNFNNQVEQQNASAINQARQINAREAARVDDINAQNAMSSLMAKQQAGVNMGQQLAQTGQYFNDLDSQKLQLGILNDMYANYGLSATDLNRILDNLNKTGQLANYRKQ